jgi:hypothetical protein
MHILNWIFRVFRYIWASPYSFLGLLLLLVALLFGATIRIVDGTLEVAGGRLNAWVSRLPHSLQLDAVTFGHVILGLDHVLLDSLRSHEQVHVRQYERWGILFIPLYLGSSLLQFLRGRHPYFANRFEREAFSKATFSTVKSDSFMECKGI